MRGEQQRRRRRPHLQRQRHSSSATTETFTADGDTLTAKGYSDQFITQSNLTLKTVAANGLGESGLGENAIGSTDCTDSQGGNPSARFNPGLRCLFPAAVLLITDLLVGSVQPNAEVFQLYAAAASGATLTSGDLIGTFSSNGSSSPLTSACPTYDGSNLCTFDFTDVPTIIIPSDFMNCGALTASPQTY